MSIDIKIKEQTIKELETLGSSELIKVYEMIISLKTKQEKYKAKKGKLAYLRVRNDLKQCRGSLSDDISLLREDRI